jgi:hypothetical protein
MSKFNLKPLSLAVAFVAGAFGSTAYASTFDETNCGEGASISVNTGVATATASDSICDTRTMDYPATGLSLVSGTITAAGAPEALTMTTAGGELYTTDAGDVMAFTANHALVLLSNVDGARNDQTALTAGQVLAVQAPSNFGDFPAAQTFKLVTHDQTLASASNENSDLTINTVTFDGAGGCTATQDFADVSMVINGTDYAVTGAADSSTTGSPAACSYTYSANGNINLTIGADTHKLKVSSDLRYLVNRMNATPAGSDSADGYTLGVNVDTAASDVTGTFLTSSVINTYQSSSASTQSKEQSTECASRGVLTLSGAGSCTYSESSDCGVTGLEGTAGTFDNEFAIVSGTSAPTCSYSVSGGQLQVDLSVTTPEGPATLSLVGGAADNGEALSLAGQVAGAAFEGSPTDKTYVMNQSMVGVEDASADQATFRSDNIKSYVRNDIDNDGTTNIIFYNSGNNAIIKWDIADGAFVSQTNLGAGPSGFEFSGTGDMNGDGTSDIVWVNPTNKQVRVWKMADGAVAKDQYIGDMTDTYSVAGILDIDGDGDDDILWSEPTNVYVVKWTFKSNPAGNPVLDVWAGLRAFGNTEFTIQGVGDIDGDGDDDAIWRHQSAGFISVWTFENADIASWYGEGAYQNTDFVMTGVGDFDKDGDDDIQFVANANNWVSVWQMQDGHKVGWYGLGAYPNTNYKADTITDLDGDNDVDIVWRDQTATWVSSWHLEDGQYGAGADWVGIQNAPNVNFKIQK